MKNRTRKIVTLLTAAVLTVGMLTGCGASEAGTATDATQAAQATEAAPATEEAEVADEEVPAADVATSKLSGSITMVGSTSMEKFSNALMEAFMQANPGVTVSPEFVGSSAGIEALLAGTADIGNSSRALKDSEKEGGAVENIVAIDGIAVAVDPSNTVVDLTKQNLVDIYTGVVTNWSELGGTDMPIVVVGRESGSGTRSAFEELLEIEDACKYANELDSTGAVMAKVASTPGAIGYVSLDVVDDTIIAVSLEGVAPTAENIKAGNYFLSRPFVMATKGEIAEQNENVQALFAYLATDEGKALIESVGLITVD